MNRNDIQEKKKQISNKKKIEFNFFFPSIYLSINFENKVHCKIRWPKGRSINCIYTKLGLLNEKNSLLTVNEKNEQAFLNLKVKLRIFKSNLVSKMKLFVIFSCNPNLINNEFIMHTFHLIILDQFTFYPTNHNVIDFSFFK